MKTFKDYHVRNIEKQEEIHVLGGLKKLSDLDLKEIANSFEINEYQVELWECRSALKDKMGQFEYYSYTLIYNHTVKNAA